MYVKRYTIVKRQIYMVYNINNNNADGKTVIEATPNADGVLWRHPDWLYLTPG